MSETEHCDRPAVAVVSHPFLGDIAVCRECADRIESMPGSDHVGSRQELAAKGVQCLGKEARDE